jgi:hypothetical protein
MTKKSRSGTKWTEKDYAAAGYAKQLRVRLRIETRAKLSDIAVRRGKSETQVIEELVKCAR